MNNVVSDISVQNYSLREANPNPSTNRLSPELEAIRNKRIRIQKREALAFNAVSLIFCLAKIFASSKVLNEEKEGIDYSFKIFLTLQITHDVSYIASLFFIIKIIMFDNSIYNTGLYISRNQNGENNQRTVEMETEYEKESVFSISNKASEKNNIICLLTIGARTFYYLLFVYATYIYLTCDDTLLQFECKTKLLFLFYIICTCGYIGMPLFFVFGLLVSLPILSLYVQLTGDKEAKILEEELAKSMVITNYKNFAHKEDECAICMLNYKSGDEIIQLICSPKHNFHKSCGNKWLKINSICPLCRFELKKKSDCPEQSN